MKEQKFRRVYVRMNVAFDENGRMRPTVLKWIDGHEYEIDRILDVRPACAQRSGGQGDRYTVRICGQERELYFEHSADVDDRNVGRWFVECPC